MTMRNYARTATALAALATGAIGLIGTAGPAAAAPVSTVLRATIHFTQDTYRPGDTVHLVVRLTNTGSTRLSGLTTVCDRAGQPDELVNTGAGWGVLRASAPGLTLQPHQTRTVDVTDRVPAGAARYGVVTAVCDFGARGVDTGRTVARAAARVPGQQGAVAGQVGMSPSSGSGPVAGLAGVRVVLRNDTGCPAVVRTVTTDAHGNFGIAHLPAEPGYLLYLYPPQGWKILDANPTPVQVIGGTISREFVDVARGSAATPKQPHSCSTSTTPSSSLPTAVSRSAGDGAPLANTGVDAATALTFGGSGVLAGLLLLATTRRRRGARHA